MCIFRLQVARAAVVSVALLLARAAHAQTSPEQYLLAAANQDRAAMQLLPLTLDDHLVLAARQHAYEMANRRTISHQFTGEPELARRAASAGSRFSLVTENVAEASNAAKIHSMWMASPGHRTNLLDPGVTVVGIAVIARNGQLYAVEDFARAVDRLTIPEQEAAVGGLLRGAGLTVTASGEARQTCTMSSGYVGPRQPWFVMRYTGSTLDRLPEQLATKLASGKYHEAQVGACLLAKEGPFASYSVAVMLFP